MEFPFRSRDANVVELLRKDHEEIKSLFRDFTSVVESKEKERIVDKTLHALELHAAVEESLFYPAVREDSPDAQDKLDESLEEHHVAMLLIAELKEMSAGDERYEAKFRVLAENVRHHIKEEEAELFARASTGKLDLIALGKRLERAKASWRPMSRMGKDRRKTRQAVRDKGIRSRRTTRTSARKPAKRTSG